MVTLPAWIAAVQLDISISIKGRSAARPSATSAGFKPPVHGVLNLRLLLSMIVWISRDTENYCAGIWMIILLFHSYQCNFKMKTGHQWESYISWNINLSFMCLLWCFFITTDLMNRSIRIGPIDNLDDTGKYNSKWIITFGNQNNYDKQNEDIGVMTELCFRFNDVCLFLSFFRHDFAMCNPGCPQACLPKAGITGVCHHTWLVCKASEVKLWKKSLHAILHCHLFYSQINNTDLENKPG